ncbi:extracellular solute-binding protein [Paenibacillus taichungensis]|uniref:Extracellular solute-binding protein n=1 Tax=Paenibacillus taichungensis TaxID=484184 RepID=A0ABX2MQX0_9BACL|nr:extracellular solute-binding protein [Paenibacillus taichungensis]PIH60845.1 sugar ABC transporter substrate-binding protein [Paenibacillus sp. LK1]
MEGIVLKALHIRKSLLSCLMVFTVILSACSNGGSDKGATEGSGTTTSDGKTIVQLKGITMGNAPASGMDNFYKQLDELTIKDLGATIRFDFVPWGDEKNQISRAIAAKEYDVYVGGAWSDFASFATKNAFANLTPLLGDVPDLVEHYKGTLDTVKINGSLYGIPQYNKPGGGGEGLLFREDLRKAWGLPEITDLDTVEQYLYKAKEAYPDTPMINDKRFADNVWTLVAGSNYLDLVKGYVVATVDEPYKAISMYDTPEYKQVLERSKKWYEDGIVSHDILAAQGNATSETLELMKADKKPLEFNNHFGAVSSSYVGALKELHPDFEYGWFDYYFNNIPAYMPFMAPDNITMISIGAHSKHVETALKLIEKAHTDRTYYNLLQYGVEGENYKLDGEFVSYEGIKSENKKPGWTGLYDGYMNLQEKYPDEWQAINDKLQNEGAKKAEENGQSPLAGFGLATSNVAAELASMETVKSQYIVPLSVGITKDIDADLANVKKQLEGAGFDKFMAELQVQLDAFAASKKY